MKKDAELILVCGRRGSGKSTTTKQLLKAAPPKLVVFDPQREYGGKGWIALRTFPELLKAIHSKWKRGFRISFEPKAGQEVKELDKLAKLLWKVQEPYDEGLDDRQLMLVVEEANLGMPNHQLPDGITGMSRIINQGRHMGINVIAVTQRPALVNKTFRANCARSYIFALAERDDQAQILRSIGNEYQKTLRTMGNYQFLVVENGTVRQGKTTARGTLSLSK